MKYILSKEKNSRMPLWPDLNEVEWFRNHEDPLSDSERNEVEKIWQEIKNSSDIDRISKGLLGIRDIIEKAMDSYPGMEATKKSSSTNFNGRVTSNVIMNAISNIKQELSMRNLPEKNIVIRKENNNVFKSFLQYGVVQFNINPKLFKRLKSHLKTTIRELVDSKRDKMIVYNRGYIMERTRNIDATGMGIIKEILDDLGIQEMAEKYYNCKWSPSTARLHVSKSDDQHCLQTLNDLIKDNPPKHKNLHIDPKLDMKCIIYLNNVGVDDGPFSYIRGSHLWNSDNIIKRNIAKANNVYNINNTPEKRKQFLCLPREAQVSSNFGNYIPDTSEKAEFIKDNLNPLLSENGNLVFFDPEGIHLGGNTKNNGMRVAIQVVMKMG